jgi:hypothetical protein
LIRGYLSVEQRPPLSDLLDQLPLRTKVGLTERIGQLQAATVDGEQLERKRKEIGEVVMSGGELSEEHRMMLEKGLDYSLDEWNRAVLAYVTSHVAGSGTTFPVLYDTVMARVKAVVEPGKAGQLKTWAEIRAFAAARSQARAAGQVAPAGTVGGPGLPFEAKGLGPRPAGEAGKPAAPREPQRQAVASGTVRQPTGVMAGGLAQPPPGQHEKKVAAATPSAGAVDVRTPVVERPAERREVAVPSAVEAAPDMTPMDFAREAPIFAPVVSRTRIVAEAQVVEDVVPPVRQDTAEEVEDDEEEQAPQSLGELLQRSERKGEVGGEGPTAQQHRVLLAMAWAFGRGSELEPAEVKLLCGQNGQTAAECEAMREDLKREREVEFYDGGLEAVGRGRIPAEGAFALIPFPEPMLLTRVSQLRSRDPTWVWTEEQDAELEELESRRNVSWRDVAQQLEKPLASVIWRSFYPL